MSRELRVRIIARVGLDVASDDPAYYEEVRKCYWTLSPTRPFSVHDFFHDSGWDIIEILSIDQTTGLKDKNEMDIYEGDIVKYIDDTSDTWGGTEEGKGLVEYIPETAWSFVPNKYSTGGPDGMEEIRDVEVIGNIYENPDLLTSPPTPPIKGVVE